MWVVILKRRAINGRIEMHVKGRVMLCVDCICLAVSGDQRWDVQNTPMNFYDTHPVVFINIVLY
jgi:hypothetical protein